MEFKLKCLISALRIIQGVLVPLERFFQPFTAWVFSRRRVSFYVILRTEKGYVGAENAFKHLAESLKSAKEIRIAVGEIGHHLMEHPVMVDSLQYAYEKNHAVIEIVHGPRVDPDTRQVIDFAKAGIVSLFRMPEYKRGHFMLVTDNNGEVTAIVEGVHSETRWMEKRPGEPKEIFASKARFFYVFKASSRPAVAKYLKNEYEQRKRTALPINEHPGLHPPQEHFPLHILIDEIAHLFIKHMIQPLAILVDLPLDIPKKSLYKTTRKSNTNYGKMHIRIDGSPSLRETESGNSSPLPKQELIRITKVHTIVHPKIKETPCSCGGTLRYETFSFSTAWNGRRLEVNEVQGYRCDREDCAVTLFPPSIGREIEWRIKKVDGTLSLAEKLKGFIRRYYTVPEN